MFNMERYRLPSSPAYLTDRQATPYSPTSIKLHLEPHSSSLTISLPILPDSTLLVITDPQQRQPLEWIPILPISNHFKLHPHSYTHTTINHILEAESSEVVQWFLKEPSPTNQQLKLVHCHLWSRHLT